MAERLAAFDLHDAVVIALPRGGVPVGERIASCFELPLDVLLIRKIGAPGQRELAVGAVSDGQEMQIVINEDIADTLGLSDEDVAALAKRELPEIERRRQLYFADHPPEPLADRTVILVDDGVATGATARMALRLVRLQKPKRLILALPVAPPSTVAALGRQADRVVCLHQPDPFYAVGTHYRDFAPVEDEDAVSILRRARQRPVGAADTVEREADKGVGTNERLNRFVNQGGRRP